MSSQVMGVKPRELSEQILATEESSAWKYLAQTGGWQTIQMTCNLQEAAENANFHFSIPIEPSDLCDLDAPLANLTMNNTEESSRLFEEIIYAEITERHWTSCCPEPSQVSVSLRLLDLPNLPEYTLSDRRSLNQLVGSERMLKIEGVIVGVSSARKRLKSTCYRCPIQTCSMSMKSVRVTGTGLGLTDITKNCFMCGCILQEDISARVLIDEIEIEVIKVEAFACRNSCSQSIDVLVCCDLIRHVFMGELVRVIGTPKREKGTAVLEANNLTKVQSSRPMESLKSSDIPRCIKILHNDMESSLCFITGLAKAFDSDIVANDAFLHVKCVILMALVHFSSDQDSEPDSRLLDILFVCQDTLLLHRLLLFASLFSERKIVHTAPNPLTVSQVKDNFYAGSVLLANGGVCVFNEFEFSKKATRDQLLQVIESGTMHVEGLINQPKKQCSVWACVESLSSKSSTAIEDDLNLTQTSIVPGKPKAKSKTFPEVFGLVVPCDIDAEVHEDQCQRVMQRALGYRQQEKAIPLEDMKQFIHIAQQLKTTFTAEAEYVIKGYYVGSRRARAMSTGKLPYNAIRALMMLAEGHAKLNLRLQVTEEDAANAVLFYELCTSALFGSSLIDVGPCCKTLATFIGPDGEARLAMLHTKLRNFIAQYAEE